METRQIQCPTCKEWMQAPADRDRIICMFCGSHITIISKKDLPLLPDEQISAMIEEVFQVEPEYLNRFDYQNYNQAFAEFYERFRSLWEQTDLRCVREDTAFLEQEIINKARQALENALDKGKKSEKRQLQYKMNSFMAVYFFPALLEAYDEEVVPFCESVRDSWAANFEDSRIKLARKEQIEQGFKRKLCYITTAACLCLGKGEECEELALLKDFRDEYLLKQQWGQALVEDYYDIAPTIVKRMEQMPRYRENYSALWADYLGPCIEMVREHKVIECTKKYSEMVKYLKREYIEKWVEKTEG